MQHSLVMLNQFGLLGHWNGARDVLTSFHGPIVPNDPTSSFNLQYGQSNSIPVCTNNLICPLGTTILPSKLTKGEL